MNRLHRLLLVNVFCVTQIQPQPGGGGGGRARRLLSGDVNTGVGQIKALTPTVGQIGHIGEVETPPFTCIFPAGGEEIKTECVGRSTCCCGGENVFVMSVSMLRCCRMRIREGIVLVKVAKGVLRERGVDRSIGCRQGSD